MNASILTYVKIEGTISQKIGLLKYINIRRYVNVSIYLKYIYTIPKINMITTYYVK